MTNHKTITLDDITGNNIKENELPPSLTLDVKPSSKGGTFTCSIIHPNTRRAVFSKVVTTSSINEAFEFLNQKRAELLKTGQQKYSVKFEGAIPFGTNRKSKGNKHFKNSSEK